MSTRRRLQWTIASVAVGCLSLQSLVADDLPSSEIARSRVNLTSPAKNISRLATFDNDAGVTYFALSVKPNAKDLQSLTSANPSRKVAILVDTSASQTGSIRMDSLSIVQQLIKSFDASTQVALLACDVDTVDLSNGLQSASSKEIESALLKLDNRVPLGTTDFEKAIRTSNRLFDDQGENTIVYIGDGIIRSRTLDSSEFERLKDLLVDSKTSVLSLAIGPLVNVEGLATIANHTGGHIFVRNNIEGSNQQIGMMLAKAALQPVIWIDDCNLPSMIEESYPANFPPLRADRDSIVLGTLKSDARNDNASIEIIGSSSGKQVKLHWSLTPETSNPDFAFLGTVVDKASTNRGLYLPTAGSDALRDLGIALASNATELVRSGRFALQSGDVEGAVRIAEEALSRDPNNVEAQVLLESSRQRQTSEEEKVRDATGSAPSPSLKKFRFIQTDADANIFGSPEGDSSGNREAGEVNGVPSVDGLIPEKTNERAATDVDGVEVPPITGAARARARAKPPAVPAVGAAATSPEAASSPGSLSGEGPSRSAMPAGGGLSSPSRGGLSSPPSSGGLSSPPSSGGLSSSIDGLSELETAGDFLHREEYARTLAAQRFETEVRAQLNSVPTMLQRDPVGVEMALKSTLADIRRAPELDPGARARLIGLVSSQIQSASRRAAEYREQSSRTEAVRAAASATERLLAESERADASVQQLVERFNALMSQQLYSEANTEIAPAIKALVPNSTIERITELESSISSNYRLLQDVIYAKRRNFIDVMYLNDKVSVPFADEPPIIYPPADVWRALSARRLEKYGSIDLSAGASPNEKRIYKALTQEVSVDFVNTPLRSVLETLAQTAGIPILPDGPAIEAGTVTLEDPINLAGVPNVSLRSALKLILEPLELTYVIEDEVMKITTKDRASARVLRLYPVGDLVVPVVNLGGGGMGGGMGGGGMGGGGMGGGGMGGGGMGGGGMGGGGMGGGGGGGGMFAVADQPSKSEAATKAPVRKSVAAPAKNAKQVVPAKPATISDARPSYGSAALLDKASTLIDSIAAENDEKRRDELEQKLSVLVNGELVKAQATLKAENSADVKTNFQAIIDIIHLALRKGAPQPWMYEALSLSMQVCEYPAKDIRRVLLSSVDFSGDVDDAVKIGKYLTKHGMAAEGLDVLRDAARSDPLRSDVYELALPAAIKLQSSEHLRWTCAGVLSQVWPESKQGLVEQAEIAAKAAYIRLTDDGQVVQAKVFENQLKEAMKRDLIVKVTWSGNADLDLSVEEPSGSICSLNNIRTPSGGILVNDGTSAGSNASEYSETYACPQGYGGEYKILVSKIWGEVAGGKVTVDVLSDFGTQSQNYQRHQIPIGDRDALVRVAVKSGRRESPIAETAVAKANARKIELGRAVLAQQAGNDNNASSPIFNSPFFPGATGPVVPGVNNPLFGGFRGAVGYRPEIRFIPSGTQMFTLGVISGDRRYVRVSPAPNFTDILQVDTFNFVTGSAQTATGTGGAGGGGGGGFGGGGVN